MGWISSNDAGGLVNVAYRIFRLPGVTEEVFRETMLKEVLPAAVAPGLNRAINVSGQNLRRVHGHGGASVWLWTVRWDGIRNVEIAERGTAEMIESVRARLERVGLVASSEVSEAAGDWTRD